MKIAIDAGHGKDGDPGNAGSCLWRKRLKRDFLDRSRQ
jgi:N-acetylmuramoyl-L-alanine amidase